MLLCSMFNPFPAPTAFPGTDVVTCEPNSVIPASESSDESVLVCVKFGCVSLNRLFSLSTEDPLERLSVLCLHLVPGNYKYITALLEVGDDDRKCICFLCDPEVVGLHI